MPRTLVIDLPPPFLALSTARYSVPHSRRAVHDRGMGDSKDLPMALDRPYSLITLRQCWQLGVDCGFVSNVIQVRAQQKRGSLPFAAILLLLLLLLLLLHLHARGSGVAVPR